jgi:hypothetical protein
MSCSPQPYGVSGMICSVFAFFTFIHMQIKFLNQSLDLASSRIPVFLNAAREHISEHALIGILLSPH